MTCFNEEIRTLLEELSQKPKAETFIALSERLVLYLGTHRITRRDIQFLQKKSSDPIHVFLSILQSKDALRRFNERIITDTVIPLIDLEIRQSIGHIFQREKLDDAVQDIFENRYLTENKIFPEEVQVRAKSFRKKVYVNRAIDIFRKEKRYRKKKKKQKEEQGKQDFDIWAQGQDTGVSVEQSQTDFSLYLYALGTKRRLVWCIYNDMSKILLFWHDIQTFIINRKPNNQTWEELKQTLENEEYPDIPTACSYIGMQVSTSQREHRRAKKTLRRIRALESALQKDKSYWDKDFYTQWEMVPQVAQFCLQFVGNDQKDLWWTPLASLHQNLSNKDVQAQLQILRKEYATNDAKTLFLFPKQKKHNQYITGKVSTGLNILFPQEDQEEEE